MTAQGLSARMQAVDGLNAPAVPARPTLLTPDGQTLLRAPGFEAGAAAPQSSGAEPSTLVSSVLGKLPDEKKPERRKDASDPRADAVGRTTELDLPTVRAGAQAHGGSLQGRPDGTPMHTTTMRSGAEPALLSPSSSQLDNEPRQLLSFRPGDVYAEDTLKKARICGECGFKLSPGGVCMRCVALDQREKASVRLV